MNATAQAGSLRSTEARLAHLSSSGSFGEGELEGLPDPVRRYLHASIAPGTPLAQSARFRMRGSIKQGRWWLPFRARQILAPLHGFVWTARVGGILVGSDRYADGDGVMEWKLLGFARVVHADGPDMAHSSVGRGGAEAVWVPTAMLPRFGVTWSATDPHLIIANYRLDAFEIELHYTLDDEARVRSIALQRWGGGPDRKGFHRFVHELTGYSTFDGVTIPSAGRAGWFDGADEWSDVEFFRYEITDLHLVT